jgi:hypothetical protein
VLKFVQILWRKESRPVVFWTMLALEFDKDSDFDENEEILPLERPDFEDDEGMDADPD